MKKLLVFFVAILVLTVTSASYVYFHFKPQYSGSLNIEGLTAPVKVYYDSFGIPHIEAQNRSDLFKAYGYVVAQDRYFQIQMQKKISSGRLSEWFGSVTLETDKALRNIGFRRWAAAWWPKHQEQLPASLKADLKSWLSGVNQCFEKCSRPLEMVLLGVHSEALDEVDVLAFSGTMSFAFTKSYFVDAVLSEVANGMDPKMLSQLTGALVVSKSPASTAQLHLPLIKDIDPLGFLPNMEGSQSWVISPSKSASGKAVLANDPHIGYSHPGVWYEAHLKAPDFELYGHFIPSIPFALIGHNQDKAWALTMSNADDLDLIVQKDIESYTTIKEKIEIKGATAVEFPVQMTEWGPVIQQVLKSDRNYIMHWGFFSDDNFVIQSFYDLNHIKKIEDFNRALALGQAPGLNVSWADKEGNIAWRIFGRFPVRVNKNNWQVLELSAGQSPYSGFVSKDESLGLVNPTEGFILSANQRPPVSFDDRKFQGYWDSSERYETLHKQLKTLPKVALQDHKKLFMSEELFGAREKMQSLLQEVEVSDDKLLETLSAWNGEASADNLALGFYFEWLDAIAREVLLQKMSEKQLEQFCDTNSYWIFVNTILQDKKSLWWGGKRAEILQSSFEFTQRFMKNRYGDIQNWKWGQLHKLTFENPLGKKKPLDKFLNLGPFPVGGSFMVPNALRHQFCRGKFDITAGPSTRRVIDFVNPLESWGILPTGNSGVIFSPYYNNQTELYLRGELRAQIMDWRVIRSSSSELLLQSPQD